MHGNGRRKPVLIFIDLVFISLERSTFTKIANIACLALNLLVSIFPLCCALLKKMRKQTDGRKDNRHTNQVPSPSLCIVHAH